MMLRRGGRFSYRGTGVGHGCSATGRWWRGADRGSTQVKRLGVAHADAAAVQPPQGLGHRREVVGDGLGHVSGQCRIFVSQVLVTSAMTDRCTGRPLRSRVLYPSQV